MNIQGKKSGTRAETRAHLMDVFNTLLLAGDAPRPKVSHIIAEARVSRSTFYDHFDGVEALLHESLEGLLSEVADCLTGTPDRERFDWLLTHIWENRKMGRELLSGTRGEQAEAILARQVEVRLPPGPDRRLMAILTAGVIITALSNWVSGRLGGSPSHLADRLLPTVSAILTGQSAQPD
ncbi:MAG: TetR/AcrR family transcriptional regulator [Pseudomonadota bacterium]